MKNIDQGWQGSGGAEQLGSCCFSEVAVIGVSTLRKKLDSCWTPKNPFTGKVIKMTQRHEEFWPPFLGLNRPHAHLWGGGNILRYKNKYLIPGKYAHFSAAEVASSLATGKCLRSRSLYKWCMEVNGYFCVGDQGVLRKKNKKQKACSKMYPAPSLSLLWQLCTCFAVCSVCCLVDFLLMNSRSFSEAHWCVHEAHWA